MIDLPALQNRLPALLEAYAQGRASVESWPFAHVISKERPAPPAAAESGDHRPRTVITAPSSALRLPCAPLSRWWYGFAIRPVTLFWIDAHIAGRARRIQSELRRHRLRHATEMSPEMEALDRLVVLTGYSASLPTGFERTLFLLRLAPLIGLLVTIGLIPLSVDVNFEDLSALSGQAIVVIGALPVAVLLLNPPVIRFGFRWKRAVFMGGTVERRNGFDQAARYAGAPTPNLYVLENSVFEALGIKKRNELSADIFLSPAVYFALNSTVGAIVTIVETVSGSAALQDRLPGLVISALFALINYWFLWQVVKRHRRRIAHGAAL